MYLYPALKSYYFNRIAFIEAPLIDQFKKKSIGLNFWESWEILFAVYHMLFHFGSWT